MDIKEFIKKAWADHADLPEDVAGRLERARFVPETEDEVRQLAGLTLHVLGEHLGRWPQAHELLDRLAECSAAAEPTARRALQRSHAVLNLAAQPDTDLSSLESDDRVAALALAASLLQGRQHFTQAIQAYNRALALAQEGVDASGIAPRALAVAGNNLACALEELPSRDAFEIEGMLAAAGGALSWWKVAGGWMEEERAEYRMARSLLAADRPQEARLHARNGLDVCQQNDAPAFERVFCWAALALAERACGNREAFEEARTRAHEQAAEVPPQDRSWCDNDLKELED